MAAFIRKQSREILVPSLPLRLIRPPKLCHMTSRPQTEAKDWAYACMSPQNVIVPLNLHSGQVYVLQWGNRHIARKHYTAPQSHRKK